MSATPDIVERWREVTAKLDPETAAAHLWKDGPVGHFLYAFRPDGARLPELFAEMPEMAPALERLRTLFHRAGPETGSMYLEVTRPRPMDDDAVRQCVRRWLSTAGSLAQSLAVPVDEDVARFLMSSEAAVEVIETGVTERNPRHVHPVESAIYEAVTEFGISMRFECEAARLLVEPLYMLACSYELAFWVLSPLANETRDDPFAPAAALWEACVSLSFDGEGAGVRAVANRRSIPAAGDRL